MSAFANPYLIPELIMNPVPEPGEPPKTKVMVHGLPGSKFTRQHAPTDAAFEHIKDGIRNLAQINSPLSSFWFRCWKQRLNQRPLRRRQIARIGKLIHPTTILHAFSDRFLDRVVASLERKLWEVPVGFKWFTPGLFDGSCCFGGEESAGASFLKRDGLILGLLAAEITARTGKDPGEHYKELTAKFGIPYYTRIDAPATPDQKNSLKKLSPEAVTATELAGEAITAKLTRAPGNNASIGGLKVASVSGWFAARPSGTENIYKLYAESLKSAEHLTAIVGQAQEIVSRSLGAK